ncbi:DUF927 domain-containing protein [Jeotgalibacillus soli]|nr:DUF927 domain-containing protein [Jeotgalibacillus soli]
MTLTASREYTDQINLVLPGAKIIKCRGYINNDEYSKAKAPLGSYKGKPSLTEDQIQKHLDKGGWIGTLIPEKHIVIDVDNKEVARYLYKLLSGEGYKFHLISTPNGCQMIFKNESEENKKIKMISKWFTSIGVIIDTRVGSTNSLIVFPTANTENREIVSSVEKVDELPTFLKPLWNTATTKDYRFPIPLLAGDRNQSIFELGSKIKRYGKDSHDLIEPSLKLVHKYFMIDKKGYSDYELQATINSITGFETPEQSNQVTAPKKLEKVESFMMPKPFFSQNNRLFKKEIKKVDGEFKEINALVSRYVPLITMIYEHIERGEVFYQISWKAECKWYQETVTAKTLASKPDLLCLADKGFSVTDLNGRTLIEYFDSFLAENDIPRMKMVDRLGKVNEEFIHPEITENISIIPSDFGYKRIVKSLSKKGNLEGWQSSVLDLIKDNPKALFVVMASFTSIVLEDLNLDPIICDLTGTTSRGKSRVLAAAASVWGESRGLINEFNATLNSLERKASFLRNYPLLIDDHNKAPRQMLEKLIYTHSGGMSKGRATIGGIHEDFTWNNMLICNGENSILNYVERAAGASARVISIEDFSFEDDEDNFFAMLSEGIENNFGEPGIAFLKAWQDRKNHLMPMYENFRDLFIKKSNNNDVLRRLSKHYAAIVFVADCLNTLFDYEIDCNSLVHLFDEMVTSNKTLDKSKELLNEILEDLDSDRRSIFYEYEPSHESKAVFKEDRLYLLPKYVKNFLGVETKQVRNDWLKKGFTYYLNQKNVAPDVKTIKHKGKTMQAIPINPDILTELGYDFKEEVVIR